MLTEEEKKEIQREFRKYATKRAAGPEALKIVQRRRGWISDDCLKEIAGFLDLASEELDSIATTYNLIFRRPVGKHIILICDSVSCWITGYEDIREHLTRRLNINLGQTTSDGLFTLLPIGCLGACEKAPVMIIDEDLHCNLTPEKIDGILGSYK